VTPDSETGSTGRPRRDPWQRRLARVHAPSGRWRYDPQQNSGTYHQAAENPPEPKNLPLHTVEDPRFYVAVLLVEACTSLTQQERDLLGAGRMLADPGGGAVIAIGHPELPDTSEAGADRVIRVPHGGEASFEPSGLAALLAQLARAYAVKHFLLPDTIDGRDICLRTAAELGDFPAIGIHKLSAAHCVRRAFGSSKDIWQAPPKCMTLRPGVGESIGGLRFEAREISVEPPVLEERIEHLGLVDQQADEIPLEEAALIVSAGNGVHAWETYRAVCRRLNATPAATRLVCDLGFMARNRQVGASGCLTRADCYVALGISGAIQHLQGIEQCVHVVAVNIDPFAPIVKRADLSIIGDANQILAEVLAMTEGVT